jgi:capsular exopolysaccharide synthesis family protein
MDIRKIFAIVKRWLWLFIVGTIIVGGLGYYVSIQETPKYQASTRFVVLRSATTGYDYYAYLDYQNLISTYTQLLTTNSLLQRVSEDVGFPVTGGANAEQIGDTQFVRLTVTNEDPQKAATIANALVSVLIEQNEQLQSVRYETTEQNYLSRAEDALLQMESLQSQIDEKSEQTVQEQILQVETQINDLQSQVTDLEIKMENIDPLLSEEERSSLRINYQAELNQIKPILELYQEIYTQLTVMGEPLQNENVSSTRIEQLQRTYDLYEQIYFGSISSLETLNLTRVQSTPNVVQVEPATVPRTPFAPRPMQTAALAGAVGLLGTAGIAFLVEYLDDTIKTPEDVKEILGLPVIGFVSTMELKGNTGEKEGTYVANHPRSPITEGFRSLRTALEFYSVDSPLRVLLVTSAGPEEGKTTVATNLAIILARSNKKVLLLDADMRRPSVHNQLNLSNRIGLSDVIRGRIDPKDAVQQQPQGIENFDVITSGSLPPNPAELIASEKMSHILDQLRDDYDMVIVDTPPAIVTDAQILSNKMDGVLYVIKPGKTRAIIAITPLEEFERVGAKMIGVIMNHIPRRRGYYYGGYGYYSPSATKDNAYYRSDDFYQPPSQEDKKREFSKEEVTHPLD